MISLTYDMIINSRAKNQKATIILGMVSSRWNSATKLQSSQDTVCHLMLTIDIQLISKTTNFTANRTLIKIVKGKYL